MLAIWKKIILGHPATHGVLGSIRKPQSLPEDFLSVPLFKYHEWGLC
jgi:hypothetical protein